jgi:hypothetical protein
VGGVAQVGRCLADALERDPVVRDAGAAGESPLAARDDVRPEPACRDLCDDGRDVVRLDRVLPDDRVREGAGDLGAGRIERREVGDEERRAEARRCGAKGLGELSQGPRTG